MRSGCVFPTQITLLALAFLTVASPAEAVEGYRSAPLLISYGYFEKDDVQIDNFKFFLAAGTSSLPRQTLHWCFVISTPQCTPCSALTVGPATAGVADLGISSVSSSDTTTLLYRSENVGMDVASHNVTLEYMRRMGRLGTYKYFFFLNSSVKGPFYPSYLGPRWHWTHAFLERLTGNVHAVSSSLVCLPVADEGGPGARMESWAFLVDAQGLAAITASAALNIRECKLCSNSSGIVVSGEYGITLSLFQAGYNVATLMSKYKEGIDWRDGRHWACNDNVHPSRHGTYDGIAQHPYETVFVKSSWHVADPYTRRYAEWRRSHLAGSAGTQGRFNQPMYMYGVSLAAQEPNLLGWAYNVTLHKPFFWAGGEGESAAEWADKVWKLKHNSSTVPWA